jgi:hypothetical protein
MGVTDILLTPLHQVIAITTTIIITIMRLPGKVQRANLTCHVTSIRLQ